MDKNDCEEFHSEFWALEITRHTPLTDRFNMHYFELPKLPALTKSDNGKELWLKLFNAETEEELLKIEELEVPIMKQAIGAYRHISSSPEFRERERLYSKARHDEAQALHKARLEGAEIERKKWQSVAEENEKLRKQLVELQSKI